MTGSDRQWEDLGIAQAADRLINAGEIAPLIIVMPEGESA
jgi:enterochelin esterase-like enzyme